MPETERLCAFCNGRISSIRGARSKFCSRDCGNEYRKEERSGGKQLSLKLREVKAKTINTVLVHSCRSNRLDPFVPADCRCDFFLSNDEAENLIGVGEAVDFESRLPVWFERTILLVGVLKKTPRAQTIEKAHTERLAEQKDLTKQDREQIKRLQKGVAEDRNWRERERLEDERADFYQALTVEAMHIRQIPADKYDAMERNDFWRGRALFSSGAFNDDRTEGGVGEDVSSPHDASEPEDTQPDSQSDPVETHNEEVPLDEVLRQEEPEEALVQDECNG